MVALACLDDHFSCRVLSLNSKDWMDFTARAQPDPTTRHQPSIPIATIAIAIANAIAIAVQPQLQARQWTAIYMQLFPIALGLDSIVKQGAQSGSNGRLGVEVTFLSVRS